MLGAFIGDTAGSFREFSKNKFPELPLLPSSNQVPPGMVYGMTDDSVLTIATWLALQDPQCRLESFRRSYYEYGRQFGTTNYGKRFREWLAGSYAAAQPYDSCGNGSAMRVSPVGWYAKSPEDCVRLARMSASVTHDHPEGVKGAVYAALMVYYYRNGAVNPEQSILNLTGYTYGRCSGYDHFDLVCQETLPLVLHVLDSTNNFHDAVKMAVTIPRADSDTVGAIVGAIAEARWGIPDELKAQWCSGGYVPREALDEVSSILEKHYS